MLNKTTLLDVLYSWNYWDGREMDTGVLRPETLVPIQSALETREIIVLKGIRRSGKSTLMLQLMQGLLHQGVDPAQLLYVNFEDYRLGEHLSLKLLESIYQIYTEKINSDRPAILFLDEVQGIPHFEKWLRTYYDQNTKIKFVISGSSATLLSRELSTLLTGRNLSFEIFPFSFLEYLSFLKIPFKKGASYEETYHLNRPQQAVLKHALDQYAQVGGFPEILKKQTPEAQRLQHQQYFEDILYKDIVHRHGVRHVSQLFDLATYCLQHTASLFTFSKLAQLLKVSTHTVMDFMGYMEEAYLLGVVSCFSYGAKAGLDLHKPKKIYALDNGLVTALSTTDNLGRRMENLVYRYLPRTHLYYGMGKQEVDFVLKTPTLLPINVSYGDDVPAREITGLEEFLNAHPSAPTGLLITEDHCDFEGKIRQIPLWVWLIQGKI